MIKQQAKAPKYDDLPEFVQKTPHSLVERVLSLLRLRVTKKRKLDLMEVK